MKYAWIEEYRDEHTVSRLCRVRPRSPNTLSVCPDDSYPRVETDDLTHECVDLQISM